MAVDCGTAVTIDGEEHVGVFDSSEWADRGFCKGCGTHLFYRLKGKQQYWIPTGLIADENAATFTHQVFIDQKPAYYAFANETTTLTEAEVFAMYAPPSDKA